MIYIVFVNIILGHCQVPCGIYDDVLRIKQIKENYTTINKAMAKINELSGHTDALSKNQLNRWVSEKEKHASKIQSIISNYFLTQRIKETNTKYLDQVTLLHKLLVVTMKCKQSIDTDNVEEGLKLIILFSEAYFDSHGLKHLNDISPK